MMEFIYEVKLGQYRQIVWLVAILCERSISQRICRLTVWREIKTIFRLIIQLTLLHTVFTWFVAWFFPWHHDSSVESTYESISHWNDAWFIEWNSGWFNELFDERSEEQKQLPEVFCKKGILINFAKFTGKHLRQNPFFNKVVGLQLY